MGTTVTMPPEDVLYRLAQRAKAKAKLLEVEKGSNGLAEHLNHVGNGYLLANTQAVREA
jgi:hypothetical protein